MFAFPESQRPHLYVGLTFFELHRGVEPYTSLRNGAVVTGKAGTADVSAVIDSVQLGPLGQFLQQGHPHVSNVGKPFDVRALVDAVEAKSSTGAKDAKVVDPREIYTAVYLRVTEIVEPAAAA